MLGLPRVSPRLVRQSGRSFQLPSTSTIQAVADATARRALATQHRHFSWKNPFASSTRTPSASTSTLPSSPAALLGKEQQQRATKAQQEASLLNERLVDACLQVLELCGGTAGGSAPPRLVLDRQSTEILWELADVMLHDFRRTPCEQFDIIYRALCLPIATENLQLTRSLMVMMECVLPCSVYRLFESTNLIGVTENEQGRHQRDVLRRLVHAMLGSVRAPPGVHDAEAILVYLDDFRLAFPHVVASSPAFTALGETAVTTALQAQLYARLRQLCAEFDKEGTGKVQLAELQATAERVLGKEGAASLLAGAVADAAGMVAYAQLTALLTRPPPPQQQRSTSQ